MNLVPGYFSGTVLVNGMAALLRHGQTWMSMTPYKIESQEIGIRLSRGHVLIFGLGMGWSTAVCALRPEVESVTVVEKDRAVIELNAVLDVAGQLPDEARAKIRVVEGDAFAYVPDRAVDCLMPDIWLPLVSAGRIEEVRRMQANVAAREIYFWGQEMEIARHAAVAGRAFDLAGIAATVASFDLPLIGPALDDYSEKVRVVAARWMADRWLEPSPAPLAVK